MRYVLNRDCQLWQPEVTTYANLAFVAVVEELRAIGGGLLNRVMPGYCRRMSQARNKANGQLQSFMVTATNSDTEGWRIVRLKRVLDALRRHPDEPVWKIEGVHDHKGELSVVWRDAPIENDLTAVQSIWHSRIGDGSGNINHQYMGEDVRQLLGV